MAYVRTHFVSLWVLICVLQIVIQKSTGAEIANFNQGREDLANLAARRADPIAFLRGRKRRYRVTKTLSASVSSSVTSPQPNEPDIHINELEVTTAEPNIIDDRDFEPSGKVLNFADYINLVKANDEKKSKLVPTPKKLGFNPTPVNTVHSKNSRFISPAVNSRFIPREIDTGRSKNSEFFPESLDTDQSERPRFILPTEVDPIESKSSGFIPTSVDTTLSENSRLIPTAVGIAQPEKSRFIPKEDQSKNPRIILEPVITKDAWFYPTSVDEARSKNSKFIPTSVDGDQSTNQRFNPKLIDENQSQNSRFISGSLESKTSRFIPKPVENSNLRFIPKPVEINIPRFIPKPVEINNSRFILNSVESPNSKFIPDPVESTNSRLIPDTVESINSRFIPDEIESTNSRFIPDTVESINSRFIPDEIESTNSRFIPDPVESLNSRFIPDLVQSTNSRFIQDPVESTNSRFIPDPVESTNLRFIPIPVESTNSKFIPDPVETLNSRFIPDPVESINSRFISDPVESTNSRFIPDHVESTNLRFIPDPVESTNSRLVPHPVESKNLRNLHDTVEPTFSRFIPDPIEHKNSRFIPGRVVAEKSRFFLDEIESKKSRFIPDELEHKLILNNDYFKNLYANYDIRNETATGDSIPSDSSLIYGIDSNNQLSNNGASIRRFPRESKEHESRTAVPRPSVSRTAITARGRPRFQGRTRLSENIRRKLYPSRRKTGSENLLKVRPPSIRSRIITIAAPTPIVTTTTTTPPPTTTTTTATTTTTTTTPTTRTTIGSRSRSFRWKPKEPSTRRGTVSVTKQNNLNVVQRVRMKPITTKPASNIKLQPRPAKLIPEDYAEDYITSYQQLADEGFQQRELEQNVAPVPANSFIRTQGFVDVKEPNLFPNFYKDDKRHRYKTKVIPTSGHFDYTGYEDLLDYANYHEDYTEGEEYIDAQVTVPDIRTQTTRFVADDDFRSEVAHTNNENTPIITTTAKPTRRLSPFRQFHTTPSSKLRAAQRLQLLQHRHNSGFEETTQEIIPATVPVAITTRRPRVTQSNGHMTPWPSINFFNNHRQRKPVITKTILDPIVEAHFQTSTPPPAPSTISFLKSFKARTYSTSKPFFATPKPIAPTHKSFFPETSEQFSPIDNHILTKIEQRPIPKKIPLKRHREVAKIPPNPFIRTRRKNTKSHEPVKPQPKRINNGPPVHPLLQPGFFERPVTPRDELIHNDLELPTSLENRHPPQIMPQPLPTFPHRSTTPTFSHSTTESTFPRIPTTPDSRHFEVTSVAPDTSFNNEWDDPTIQAINPFALRNPNIVHHQPFSQVNRRNRRPVFQTNVRHHRIPQSRFPFESFPATIPRQNSRARFRPKGRLDFSDDIPQTTPSANPFKLVINRNTKRSHSFTEPPSTTLAPSVRRRKFFQPTFDVVDIAQVPHLELLKTKPHEVPFQNAIVTSVRNIPTTPAPFQVVTRPIHRHIPFNSGVTTQSPIHSVTTAAPINGFRSRIRPLQLATPVPINPFHHPTQIFTTPAPVFRSPLRTFNTAIPFLNSPIPTATLAPFVFKYPSRNTQSQTRLYNSNNPVFLRALGQTHAIPVLLPILGLGSENADIMNETEVHKGDGEKFELSESELSLSNSDIYPRPLHRFSPRRN